METFEINTYPGMQFRAKKISPVKILALSTQMELTDLRQTETVFTFALENLEVKIGEKWFDVKQKDKDIFMPMGIDENFTALNELIAWFIENQISKPFMKSSE